MLSPWCPTAIGKRREYLKKLAWYHNWCGELDGDAVDGRTAEWIRMREIEYQVCAERAEGGHC